MTGAEYTYKQAVTAAEGVRQTAVTAAFATYSAAGFTSGARNTYSAAVATAQQAYITAVESAMATLSGAVTGGEPLSTLGLAGPIGSNIANLVNGY
jgi:hypothetical protein